MPHLCQIGHPSIVGFVGGAEPVCLDMGSADSDLNLSPFGKWPPMGSKPMIAQACQKKRPLRDWMVYTIVRNHHHSPYSELGTPPYAPDLCSVQQHTFTNQTQSASHRC